MSYVLRVMSTLVSMVIFTFAVMGGTNIAPILIKLPPWTKSKLFNMGRVQWQRLRRTAGG